MYMIAAPGSILSRLKVIHRWERRFLNIDMLHIKIRIEHVTTSFSLGDC
jgi:hypothetical protein